MVKLPPTIPPLPRDFGWKRDLPMGVPFEWLKSGWADFLVRPGLSLAYGFAVFLISVAIAIGIFHLNFGYLLFPALAGFLIVAPLLAIGLYEKSREIERGGPLGLASMVFVKPRSGGQLIFTGLLLALLMLLWTRAAVLLYALFFGMLPFAGYDEIMHALLKTPQGWALLVVGTLVGGLFAAFSFAISVFSIPMLVNERTDALTAMGTSMALVWNNLGPMLVWGAIVLVLTAIGIATGLTGLIVVFPVLGHATWHAYMAVRQDPAPEEAIGVLDGAEA
ncbi:MAG: hypothetical protein A49_08880 [Methyloceanibacter sp.]|nr:MAG: hypothetical protein A49_08880 [Methyloceanibacter sp.]